MIWMMDAKSFYKRTSPFTGKLGRKIIDARLTLRNEPAHPALLGDGFNGEGVPAERRAWIEGGTLTQLRYDRYTAQEHHVPPTPAFDAPALSGEGASAAQDLDALIASTERGILVTNFWYIRSVNPTDLTLTGMTRDGTFLIEDGRIAGPVLNFRWHESPLHALNNVDAYTSPMDAITNEHWKMQLPAMKLRDFNFSSVTRF
jgi:predicted Zn-dependent protease